MSVAMPATATAAAAVSRRRVAAADVGGGKHRKFLRYLRRTAMRAFRPLPVARTDEDFAVAFALLTMKFVNRHEGKITFCGGSTSGNRFRQCPDFNWWVRHCCGARWCGSTAATKLGHYPDSTEGNEDNEATSFLCLLLFIFYGDNFSRCGKWSRFQRAKAASLVSAKRNFSVGDSTWSSQKTTLAFP